MQTIDPHAIEPTPGSRMSLRQMHLLQAPMGGTLVPGGNGHWAVFIPGLKDGDPYMYFVDGQGSSGYKRDPHARLLTIEPPFPKAHSVLRNPAAFPWHEAHFTPPPFNEL